MQLVIVMLEYRVLRDLIKLLLAFSFISFSNSFVCGLVSYADFKYMNTIYSLLFVFLTLSFSALCLSLRRVTSQTLHVLFLLGLISLYHRVIPSIIFNIIPFTAIPLILSLFTGLKAFYLNILVSK